MSTREEKKKNKGTETLKTVVFFLLCVGMIVFSFLDLSYANRPLTDRLIGLILPLVFGVPIALALLKAGNSRLFCKPTKLLYLLPCLAVAVDNFPFYSYFTGKSSFAATTSAEIVLFIVYCLLVGSFEEFVFRGVAFSLIASKFSKDKKGLLFTFFISSAVFGAAHLFNVFAGAGVGAVVLQTGYSTLIGGLCAYALMKTKNVAVCALVHATYNFCGLLLDAETGLGTGVVFDLGTKCIMAIVGVVVGVFVLYGVFTYSEEEREILYERLGFGVADKNNN